MAFSPKNILVTGGAGFIGSHFIIYMLQRYKNINIINLDKLTYAASLDNLNSIKHYSNYRFIKGDICDPILIPKILREYAIDTLINFAAESHVDRSIEDSSVFIVSNVQGTHNLLKHSLNYWQSQFNLDQSLCRFHQISTDEVYGSLKLEDLAFTEESPYRPNSPYSASKAAADHIVKAFFQTYHLPITISNCSNNYGAHQHFEKLIPKIIHCCLELQPIPIYSNGQNIRDWIHSEDHCSAIDLILQQGKIGQNYNVGGSTEISNIDMTLTICDIMDNLIPENAPHQDLITFVKDRPGHDFRYAIDTDLMKSMGWTAKTQLKNALIHLVKLKLSNYAGLVQ